MKAKDLLCSSAFMMSAALIISLVTNMSGLFPGEVLTSHIRSNVTIILLAIMMTLSLSRIPSRDLGPKGHGKQILKSVVLGLVVASAIPIIGYLVLSRFPEYRDYAAGWVFIAATPFAASVGPLSFILRGDMEHAVRSTIYVYIAALLWIPLVIYLLLGTVVNMTNVVITVIEIIGVPILVSRLITGVKIDKTMMAVTLNCIISFLVWLSVSSTSFSSGWVLLVLFGMIAVLRTFVLGNTVEAVERRMGVHWSQRVTDILITSYKNKGIAIALCVSVLPGPMIPYAMVAVATSIVVEICWVAFMDSVLFSKKRMDRELKRENSEI